MLFINPRNAAERRRAQRTLIKQVEVFEAALARKLNAIYVDVLRSAVSQAETGSENANASVDAATGKAREALFRSSVAAGTHFGFSLLDELDIFAAGKSATNPREEFMAALRRHVSDSTGKKITGIQDTLKERIAGIIGAGMEAGISRSDITKQVSEINIPNMVNRIVATETHGAAMYSLNESARIGTAQRKMNAEKEWVSVADHRTRADHVRANGQMVKLDGKFIVGGAMLDHPGDPRGPAKQVINCRCVQTIQIIR